MIRRDSTKEGVYQLIVVVITVAVVSGGIPLGVVGLVSGDSGPVGHGIDSHYEDSESAKDVRRHSRKNRDHGGSNAPNPAVTSVDIPETITIGESFTVEVDARNGGTTAGGFSTITVSSPSLNENDDGSQLSVIDHDLGYGTTEVAGNTIFDRSGNEMTADYALAEVGTTAGSTWDAGASHSLSVEFTPESTGTFVVYVRTTMTSPTSNRSQTAPSNSAHTDQQGYTVQRHTVTVREEPAIDAEIVDQTIEGGEYDRGETVDATAIVENTGNREHTFFVGYTVYDETGQDYDNDDQTGRQVTLEPNERRTVDLSWDVPDRASSGTYDARISVWRESDRNALDERLADIRDDETFTIREPSEISAAIVESAVETGYYGRDETIGATATIRNTGNREHTFFVGYSVYDETGQPYDNNNGTGTAVTLTPGEQQQVSLEWSVQENAPIGYYDARVSIWRESDPDALDERLADVRKNQVFEVAPEVDVTYEVSKQSSIEGYEVSGDPISGATVTLTGEAGRPDVEGVTGEDGTVTFSLPVGRYDSTVSASGYETTTGALEIDSETAQVVGVGLVRDGVGLITVDVVDGSGEPVAGNAYRVLVDGEQAAPNAEGEILVENGTRQIRIEPTGYGADQGYVATERSVSVESGARTSITMSPIPEDIDRENLTYEVLRVNGNESVGDIFHTDRGIIRSITMQLNTSAGGPATGLNPRLERGEETMSAVESASGVYQFTPTNGVTAGFTGYHQLNVTFADTGVAHSIEIALNDESEPLPHPIRGWTSHGVEKVVSVDGSEYRAVRVSRMSSGSGRLEGWIIFTQDGSLVRDAETVRKASLTAEMSLRFSAEETMENYLGDEYPSDLQKILQQSQGLHIAIAVRDESASILGSLTMAIATGGTSAATVGGTHIAGMSGRAAAKVTANEIAEGVAMQIRDEAAREVRAMTAGQVLDLYERSTRQKAHDELRESIVQSNRAAQVLEERPDDANWRYEDAQQLWNAYNESIHDGILWSEVREQTMPSGAPADQLQSIGINFADGATGEAIDVGQIATFADLLLNGDAGDGYRRAIEQTSSIRQNLNQTEQAWTQVSPLAQRTVRNEFGSGSVYEDGESVISSAAIEIEDGPSGQYVAGERVNATVRVQNTGDTAARFFVGYSVRTESESGPLFFDGHDSTGHWITLAAHEETTTNVSWRVQESAPVGQQYDVVTAVWNSYPSPNVTRYDDATAADVFEVSDPSATRVTGIDAPSEVPVNASMALRIHAENTGSAGGELLANVTANGEVAAQRSIFVPADDSKTANVSLEFSSTGVHDVVVGNHSTTVSVIEAAGDEAGERTSENQSETPTSSNSSEDGAPAEDTNETTSTGNETTETESNGRANSTTGNETINSETPGSEQADNETIGNETVGDVTISNGTAGNQTGNDTSPQTNQTTIDESERPPRTVDGFEDGDLAEYIELVGPETAWGTSDARVSDRNIALRYLGSDGPAEITSFDGLSAYPEKGDVFRFDFGTFGEWDFRTSFNFGQQPNSSFHDRYELELEPQTDTIRLQLDPSDGDDQTLGTASVDFQRNTFYTAEVDWAATTDEITVQLYETNSENESEPLGTISADEPDGAPTEGGIGVFAHGDGDRWVYDNIRIRNTSAGASRESSLLEIVATEEGEIDYEIQINGSAEKARLSEKIGAGPNDDIRRIDSDTVLIDGYTGNTGYGDAYRFDGEIINFTRIAGDVNVTIRIDGERQSAANLSSHRLRSELPRSTRPHPLVEGRGPSFHDALYSPEVESKRSTVSTAVSSE